MAGLLLEPLLSQNAPFVASFPAVMLVSLWCGFLPAIATAIVSLGGMYIFGELTSPFADQGQFFHALWVTLNNTGIAVIGHYARESRRRTQEQAQIARRSQAMLERYQLLVQHGRDIALFIRYRDGKIIEANRAAELAYGYSREQLLSLTIADLRSPCQQDNIPEHMEAANGPGVLFETIHRRADGSEFHVEVSSRGIDLDNERILLSVVRDITERREAQAALHAAEIRQRTLLDAIPDPAWLNDQDGRIIAVNRAWVRFAGREADEVFGFTPEDLFPPEIAAQIESENAHVLQTGQELRVERKLSDRAGNEKWFDIIKLPVPDAEGKVIGTAGIARDITAKREAQQALIESEARFRAVVENAPDGIVLADVTTGNFHSANPTFCRMLGYELREICTLSLNSILPEAEREGRWRQLLSNAAGSEGALQDVKILRKDGSSFYADVSTFPIRLGGRDYLGGFFRDMTERHESREAKRAYEARLRSLAMEASLAEERERRKLSVYLHDEVCQYLALARIKLSLVRSECDPEKLRETCRDITSIIDRSNNGSRSLMLQLSHPALYELGFAPAAEWLAEDFKRLYGLHVHFSEDEHEKPIALPLRVTLYQCLRELLVNVAKHAGTAHATVRVERHGSRIRVTVEDEGRGFIPHSASRPDHKGGYGLFSIRERLISMDGHMHIHSAPGMGTKVTLDVPVAENPDAGTDEMHWK